jgi:predicted alpha/beta-hydrolase family hydrolase
MTQSATQAENFRVDLASGASVSARWYPGARETTLLLAHGAGAGHDHPFMTMAGRELSARGLDVVTFNFPYMEARRKVPDGAAVLEAAYLDVIAAVRSRRVLASVPLVIGGKSMGGRMASHVAAHHAERAGELAGLVFLGYPLHPPGRPAQSRDAHLPAIRARMLFVQGSRDAFGTPEELRPVLERLAAPVELFEVEGGDHSFAVSKKGPVTQADVYAALCDRIASWIRT